MYPDFLPIKNANKKNQILLRFNVDVANLMMDLFLYVSLLCVPGCRNQRKGQNKII